MEWLALGFIFGILIIFSFAIGLVIGVKMASKKAVEIMKNKLKEVEQKT